MDTKQLDKKYVINTYTRVGPVFVKGKGSWLWDNTGKKYLDLFPGWGVGALGHCHKKIVAAINQQAKRLINLPNNLYHQHQAALAKVIIQNSFAGKVFFANSGAEGIEGAIKLSRLYGGKQKRYEVIVMKDSFHGRTFAAMSATGQDKYKIPFKPIVPGFKPVAMNDFAAFKRAVTAKTVAVLMELVQGEGGVNLANKEYVQKVSSFCQKHKLLFMVDEVQTGIGRTGQLFAFQHYGVKPAVLILAKGLGAGVPISALVVKAEYADLFKPGLHASTFGGGPLVTRAALETFRVIQQDKLLAHTKKMGSYLLTRLKTLKTKYRIVKAVRGIGLMCGLELTEPAQPIFLKCLSRGLIINATHQTVLRIMPALNVKKSELDQGLAILETVIKGVRPQVESNSDIMPGYLST